MEHKIKKRFFLSTQMNNFINSIKQNTLNYSYKTILDKLYEFKKNIYNLEMYITTLETENMTLKNTIDELERDLEREQDYATAMIESTFNDDWEDM